MKIEQNVCGEWTKYHRQMNYSWMVSVIKILYINEKIILKIFKLKAKNSGTLDKTIHEF